MSVLELRDLHVTYRSERGDVPAVRGVDLTIEPGETVGLPASRGAASRRSPAPCSGCCRRGPASRARCCSAARTSTR